MKTFKEFLNEQHVEEIDEGAGARALAAIGICLSCLFGVVRCNNHIATEGLEKLGENTIENYTDYNQEGWGKKLIAGGDAGMKTLYGAVVELAREKDISCYDAAREIKGTFTLSMKSKFSSINKVLNLDDIANVTKTKHGDIDCVVVTCKKTAGDEGSYEYYDVVIPEFEAQAQ